MGAFAFCKCGAGYNPPPLKDCIKHYILGDYARFDCYACGVDLWGQLSENYEWKETTYQRFSSVVFDFFDKIGALEE